jgi:hypothetical protein
MPDFRTLKVFQITNCSALNRIRTLIYYHTASAAANVWNDQLPTHFYHHGNPGANVSAGRCLMNQITKRLEQVLDTVRTMSPDQQDLLAVELLERAQDLTRPATRLTAEERAELEAELAAARRGELATDAEVIVMYAKHGL